MKVENLKCGGSKQGKITTKEVFNITLRNKFAKIGGINK